MRSSDASALARTVAGRSASHSTKRAEPGALHLARQRAEGHDRLVRAGARSGCRRTSRCRRRDGPRATASRSPAPSARRATPLRVSHVSGDSPGTEKSYCGNARPIRTTAVLSHRRATIDLPHRFSLSSCSSASSTSPKGGGRTSSRRWRGACGPALLDVHTDADHHRSVFTLGERRARRDRIGRPRARRRRGRAARSGDHDGRASPARGHRRRAVRPVGADPAAPPPSTRRAPSPAGSAPSSRSPPSSTTSPIPERARCRRFDATRSAVARPDTGPSAPHPRLGATAVGARPALVAVNLELDDDDLDLARASRTRSGSATAASPACGRSVSRSPPSGERRSA